MAEDVAGLLGPLGIKPADVFGCSLGGVTALRLAIQHPDLVRKLVVASSSRSNDGYYPSIVAGWPGM
ncbi:MAG: alpha/beta hydrolase [Chloroflexi bacterium]|nr:alpha/beta hydrolase [Chloroflexota bacterium]